MVEFENECVGCPPEIGCLGSACPKRNVPHLFCDSCEDEFESNELYMFDGEMLCSECLLNKFEKVSESEKKWTE